MKISAVAIFMGVGVFVNFSLALLSSTPVEQSLAFLIAYLSGGVVASFIRL